MTQTSQFARKVVLNSDLKTSSVNTAAQFKLREGIKFERNYIGVVNVESASLQTPSILHSETLAGGNQFIVDNVNYWDSDLHTVFTECENWDMTSAFNVLTLYAKLLQSVPVDSFTLSFTGSNATVQLDTRLLEEDENILTTYARTSDGNVTDNLTVAVPQPFEKDSYIMEATINETIEAAPVSDKYFLKYAQDTVFNDESVVYRLTSLLEAAKEFKVTFTAKKDIQISGPILKFFGWYDESGVTIDTASEKTAVIQNKGYDFLNIHTNLGRSVMTGDKSDSQIKRGNILWTLPVSSLPSETLLFTNYNNGGKLPYQDEMVEEIYVYFTDIWGDRVPVSKFSMVLLFDAHEIETATPGPTIKRARTQMLEALNM